MVVFTLTGLRYSFNAGSPMQFDASKMSLYSASNTASSYRSARSDSDDDYFGMEVIKEEEHLWFPDYKKDIYDFMRSQEVGNFWIIQKQMNTIKSLSLHQSFTIFRMKRKCCTYFLSFNRLARKLYDYNLF